MSLSRRSFLSASTLAFSSTMCPRAVWSAAYPARSVRVIVPFAPGGPNDIVGRIIAKGLSDSLGRSFYVENIGGAGGNIGMGQAAKAAPDGHTVLIAAPSVAVNPALFGTVPYDLDKSFDAVTLAATAPTVLTVHPSVVAQSVDELVASVKASPGKFSYASPGAGTPPHLVGELFRLSLGLDLVHVPYKSGGLAIASTIAGHTPISFGAVPPAVGPVQEGKLRALALTSSAGSPAMPGVPTIAEAGFPGIGADIWTAVLVPAGTSGEIIDVLQREIAQLMRVPTVAERMASLGYRPVASTPAECASHIQEEARKWAKVIRDAGITVQ